MGRGASAPEIAHHVERSAEPGDMAAVELLRDAANDAAARAPTSAARWFDAAFELLPATAPVETRRDLLVGMAGSKAAAGDLDGAHAAFLEAVALTPRDDPLHIPLIRGIVGVEQLTGKQLTAKARLEEALGELGDEPSPSSVTLKIALSTNGIYLDERDEMFTWGREAVKDADGLEDPLLVAAANSALTLGSAFTGRLEIALEHADRATEMIDSLSDEELAKGIDAIGSLAGAELYLDRFESSGRHGERGIRVARETGQGELIAMLHPALGTSLWVLGELERSREILGSALESARLSKNAQAIAWAAFNLEYVALIAGELDDALALGEESVALTEDMGDGLVSSHAGVVHGATLMEMGRNEEGIDLMTRRAGAQGQRIAPGPWRATYLEDLVRAKVALGQLDEAAESARWTREQAERVPLPVAHVMAARAEAHVLLAQGSGGSRRQARAAGSRGGRVDQREAPRRDEQGVRRASFPGRGGPGTGRPAARARSLRVRRHGCGPLPRRGRGRASPGRTAERKEDEEGVRSGGRDRLADWARTRGRRAHPRPAHEQGDCGRALPQPEDGREPRAEHLRKARRFVPGRDRAGDGGSRRRAHWPRAGLRGPRESPRCDLRRRVGAGASASSALSASTSHQSR